MNGFKRVLTVCGNSMKKIDKFADKAVGFFIRDDGTCDTIVAGHKYEMNRETLEKIKDKIYFYEPREFKTYAVKIAGVDCRVTAEVARMIVNGCKEIS